LILTQVFGLGDREEIVGAVRKRLPLKIAKNSPSPCPQNVYTDSNPLLLVRADTLAYKI